MALKKKISKDDFEKLPEVLKSEYVEKEGNFVLEVEGEEDVTALKNAKEHEKQAAKEAKAALKKAQDELAELKDGQSRSTGDVAALEESWKKKFADKENEFKTALSAKDSFIQKSLVDSVAMDIATKISKSPNLILPHIKSRLTADLTGETPVTKVLDSNGKVSALTLDELKAEITANKDFAPILIGSNASGSGASSDGKNSQRVGGATGEDGKPVQLGNLSPRQLAEHITANSQAKE